MIRLTWILVTSPLEYVRLAWRGLTSGYDYALVLARFPVPFALHCLLIGLGIALAAAAALLVLSLAKRRRVRVFVSYHHSLLGMVEALAGSLRQAHMHVAYVPFTTAPEHDALLDQIRHAIHEADFVVVLPGPQASFVDHEVMAAAVAGKPILLVISRHNGASPNTAQRSYPAFVLEEILSSDFTPLRNLIDCLHGGTRQVWRSLTRFSSPPAWLSRGVLGALVVLAVLVFAAMFLAGFLALGLVAFGDIGQGMVMNSARFFAIPLLLFFGLLFLLAAAPILYLGGILLTSSQRVLAAKLVARQVRNGTYAHAQLERLGNLPEIDAKLLEALWKVPPLPYHLRTGS